MKGEKGIQSFQIVPYLSLFYGVWERDWHFKKHLVFN